jgi:adenylate cyclase
MAQLLKLREAGLAVAIAAVLLLACGLMGDSTILRSLETASFDLRFRVRGVMPPDSAIAVVLIDDRSLSLLGRWPLSRRLYARAIDRLTAARAKVIVFDLMFPESESAVISVAMRRAAGIAAAGTPLDGEARAALRQLASSDPDAEFAVAMTSAKNVLLPVGFDFRREGDEPSSVAQSAYTRFEKSPVEPEFPLRPGAAIPPVEVLARSAAGLGEVELAFDLDGSPRYDYAAVPFKADFVPALPVRTAASYLGVPWSDVALRLGSGVGIGPIELPTNRSMRYLINYRGPRGTFDTYSFADLINERLPLSAFAGRIVLIGASFLGNPDSYASPFGNTPLPGTERIANAISTILHRDFIVDLGSPGWSAAAFAAVLAMAALTGITVAVFPTSVALLAAILPLFIWYGVVQWAFANGVWLPLVSPLVALAAAAALPLSYRYWVVDRKGRQVRESFRHYMAPELVDILAEHPERLRLGGETRLMTMMFADIRGFTTISERYKADPQALTRLINRFLTPMTDIILARRGTIDKYIGDCVMAFWNAPLDDADHAQHACESGLAMLAALGRLNLDLCQEAGLAGQPFVPLRIGIGINSGECVVGNMGSERRFDYSVLGDAVNLASRLESQSKTYGVDIVLGEATQALVPGWATLELDLIAVKGKTDAVRIFALLGGPDTAAAPDYRVLATRHAQMLHHYRTREWEEARRALAQCRELLPRLGTLYDLYDDRIAHHMTHPVESGWTGVFVANSK